MRRAAMVIGIAWLLYILSWTLPVLVAETGAAGIPIRAWEAFVTALTLSGVDDSVGVAKRIIMVSSSLTNFLMILSPVFLFWKKLSSVKRVLTWLFILAAILNAQWLMLMGLKSLHELRAGYYLWCTSFLVLAIGCFFNGRTGQPEHS